MSPDPDTAALLERLRAAGVPRDAYHLLEAPWHPPADHTHVLEHVGGTWRVSYVERGSRVEEAAFPSEGDACAELLRRLRREFPAPAEPPDRAWPAWVRYPLLVAWGALVVTGLLAARPGRSAGVALRVVVSAVVLPALLAPLVLWGRDHRARRGARQTEAAPARPRALTAAELGPLLRAAGHSAYADRLDDAREATASAEEFLPAVLLICRDLLRDHPDLPPDLRDQVQVMVRDLSALLG